MEYNLNNSKKENIVNKRMRFRIEDDLFVLKEVLKINPFNCKSGWKSIADNTAKMLHKSFTERAIRERIELLLKYWDTGDRSKFKMSGTDEQHAMKEELIEEVSELKKRRDALLGKHGKRKFSYIMSDTLPSSFIENDKNSGKIDREDVSTEISDYEDLTDENDLEEEENSCYEYVQEAPVEKLKNLLNQTQEEREIIKKENINEPEIVYVMGEPQIQNSPNENINKTKEKLRKQLISNDIPVKRKRLEEENYRFKENRELHVKEMQLIKDEKMISLLQQQFLVLQGTVDRLWNMLSEKDQIIKGKEQIIKEKEEIIKNQLQQIKYFHECVVKLLPAPPQ